jgi:hypothetical protein
MALILNKKLKEKFKDFDWKTTKEGKYAITNTRSSMDPFLTYSVNICRQAILKIML